MHLAVRSWGLSHRLQMDNSVDTGKVMCKRVFSLISYGKNAEKWQRPAGRPREKGVYRAVYRLLCALEMIKDALRLTNNAGRS